MSAPLLFRISLLLLFTLLVGVPLSAEEDIPQPPMPNLLPEEDSGEVGEGDGKLEEEKGSEDENTNLTDDKVLNTSLTLVDWSSFFAHYDWSVWDERVATWYANCYEAALITPPMPSGARMHHSLGVEEWFSPFDVLCPNLESIIFGDIQTWQVRVEEHIDAVGHRSFWTLIGNTIIHKLSVPTTFNPTEWVCSFYEPAMLPEWLFSDETRTMEWLSVRDRSHLAISLTILPTGMLSTYNTLMIELAEAERVEREAIQNEPEVFAFTRIDVSEKDVFFEFYNPQNVRLNLLTKLHLDDPWNLFGEVGETSSLGYTTITFPRQTVDDPPFFRIVDAVTDTDGDGLSDGLELNYFKSDPTKQDSSGSGISDWDKVYVYQLDPNQRDCDDDGLIDSTEIVFGTNPLNADSDNDGLTDAEEVSYLQPASVLTWIPITTSILDQKDTDFIELALSTPIQISGKSYDKASVHTRGCVTLTSSLSNGSTKDVVITGHNGYPYLFVDEESDILFEETTFNDTSCFVFSFINLLFDEERTSQNRISFQIVLSSHHANRVWMNYLEIGADKWGWGAIAQIQNQFSDQEAQFPRENNDTLMTQISLEGRFGNGTNPLQSDSDQDGLLDGLEIKQIKSSPLTADTDGDSLTDGDEYYRHNTSPLVIDTDGDSLTDTWEVRYGLDPCSAEGANGRLGDPDGDLLANEIEAQHQTSPILSDTDGDGLSDIQECGRISIQTTTFDLSLGTSIGTLTSTSNCDSLTKTFSLPTPIRTNAGTYSNLFISLDGYLLLFNQTSESLSDLSYTNVSLHRLTSNHYALVVAACWSDLYYFAGKTSITLSETDTHYFVNYHNVGLYNSRRDDSVVGSFIIRLPKALEDPISIYYSAFASSFSLEKATIGIRTEKLSDAMGYKIYQYAYNQADAVTAQQAVHFSIGSSTDPCLQDSDKDGILDGEELSINTSPFNSDCDLDGMPDGWELMHALNPLSVLGVDGADGDNDNDWLRNGDEYRANTSPTNPDSDADGLLDSYEYGAISFYSGATWKTIASGMTDITNQFSSTSSGHIEVELPPITFSNTTYTTLSINLNGRIDLFRQDDVPDGLNTSVIRDYNGVTSQHNHIHLAPAASHLFLSDESSIWHGTTTIEGVNYVVVEFRNMGYYYQRADFENHQISVQVLIPKTITPAKPILVHYGVVKGELCGNNVSIGFTVPTHTKGRGFSYCVANKLTSGDSLAFFLGVGTHPIMADSDCDSLVDLTELNLGTNPLQPDTDGDGLTDGWEIQYQYDALINNDTDDVEDNEKDADPDGDGLINQEEETLRTHPRSSDSDGDGVSDKTEIDQCSHPMDAQDEGIPMTYYPVTVEFGDWSTSHSEKYYLTIKPLGDAASNENTIGWVNLQYGQVETKIALLKKGVTYEVALTHASSNQDKPDLDYTLNMTSPNGSGIVVTEASTSPFGEFNDSEWEKADRVFRLTLAGGDVYCDINRDGAIKRMVDGVITRGGKKILHHWSNDDYDNGNCSDDMGVTDIPKGKQSLFNRNDLNYRDNIVNGRADLLDFIPLWFDIADLMNVCPLASGYVYTLSASQEVGIVFADLTADSVFNWHTSDVMTYDKHGVATPAYEAVVYAINEDGLQLNQTLLDHLASRVVMLEGCEPGDGELKLVVTKDDKLISEIVFQFKIVEVEEMYRRVDITSIPHSVAKPNAPRGLSDSYFTEDAPYLFFLHGFNVTPTSARGWHAEMFKRLWQTGSEMKFVGVTWYGEEGVFEAFHYQENVRNALLSGEALAALLSHYAQDKTVVMAHSLGNMVVSSAIQFYEATCDTFIMLNSAIPSEAFGAIVSDAENYADCSETEQLFVPEAWHTYPCKSWSTHWHELFTKDAKESKVTWQGLFNDILQKEINVYNFYSSEDEVFELHNTVPSMLSGTEFDLDWPYVDDMFPYLHLLSSIKVEASRYAWQKQEVFKGMNGPIGTEGGGWSFHCRERGFKVYPTGDGARNATDEQLRERPVFSTRETPFLSNASQYTNEDYFTLLALHMPALTPAMGRQDLSLFSDATPLNPIDMVEKKEKWGRVHFEYEERWLHSDVKNMAYFYVHELFKTLSLRMKD